MNESYDTCSIDSIQRFLNGRLDLTEQESLESHLDHCDQCCDRLDNMTADVERWSQVEKYLSGTLDKFSFDTQVEPPRNIPLDFLNSIEVAGTCAR